MDLFDGCGGGWIVYAVLATVLGVVVAMATKSPGVAVGYTCIAALFLARLYGRRKALRDKIRQREAWELGPRRKK